MFSGPLAENTAMFISIDLIHSVISSSPIFRPCELQYMLCIGLVQGQQNWLIA